MSLKRKAKLAARYLGRNFSTLPKIIATTAFFYLIATGIIVFIQLWSEEGKRLIAALFGATELICLYFIGTTAYHTLTNRLYTTEGPINGDIHECKYKFLCNKCIRSVPIDSHHCGICDLCLLNHNHHCLFLGVCIARGNRSAFKRFILWGILGSLILLLGTYCPSQDFHSRITNTGHILTISLIPLLLMMYTIAVAM